MIRRIKKYCEANKLFAQGDRVVIGVSGGADSVFLAYAMKELSGNWALSLHMAHVHHGIRGPEADRDEEFCRGLAQELGMPITVFHGNVPELAKERGMTEEEAGRELRYRCMEGLCRELGYDKIAVAHHQDDQAETVLFQLLRGSGMRGMGGMRPARGNLVRPLLSLRRREIEEELERMGKEWCEDSTNQELSYTRNQLRHQVIPCLEREVSSGAVRHLANTAEMFQELADYLDGETARAVARLATEQCGGAELDAEGFARLHPVLQRECMLFLLGKVAGSRKDITSRHVESMCHLASGPTGRRIQLPYGMQAGKDYGSIWLRAGEGKAGPPSGQGGPIPVLLPQEGDGREYALEDSLGNKGIVIIKKLLKTAVFGQNMGKAPKNNCTKWFDYDKISGMLEFRHPQRGDYLQIDSVGRRKKVSRLFIDRKVPRERREAMWVLAMGGHVLWIPELGRSTAAFAVTEDTEEILHVHYSCP